VANEVGERVDGLGDLDEGVLPLVIHPLDPGGDGFGFEEEHPGGLDEGPSPGRLEFQDRQALDRRVIGTSMGRNADQADILDADFLPKEGDLLVQTVDLGGMAGAGVEAVRGPAAGRDEDVVGQGEDMQDRGLDPSRPPLGKGEITKGVTHHRPPESAPKGHSGGYHNISKELSAQEPAAMVPAVTAVAEALDGVSGSLVGRLGGGHA
jgi:hypothetical protein